MSGRLTRSAYEQLIEEDIAVLMQSPRTLERDHIKQVLLASAGHEYPDDTKRHNESLELDALRDAAALSVLILLETLHLYPNYRVDNRGPTGQIVDAIELASQDIGWRLRNGESPGDLLNELESKPYLEPTSETTQAQFSDATVFERILAGEIPATKVYEDELVLAFHDAKPQAPVHVVIVPKHKIISLGSASNVDAIVLGFMLLSASKVAKIMGVSETGFRLVWNVGEHAGQSVAYLHCHLLAGKPLGEILPKAVKYSDDRERAMATDPPMEGQWVHSWTKQASGARVLTPIRFRYSPEGVRLWFNHGGVLVTEPDVWIPIVEACKCGHEQKEHADPNRYRHNECQWCLCTEYRSKLWKGAPTSHE